MMKRKWLVLFASVFMSLSLPVFASSNQSNVTALFTAWSQVQTLDKVFSEEQFDPLLEISQRKSGEMHYRAPNVLKQIYKKPFAGSIVFTKNMVKMDFPNRKLSFSVDNAPVIAAFSRTLLNILNGNLALLKKDFSVQFLPQNNSKWFIKLTPISAMKHHVEEVLLAGDKMHIQSILFTHVSGDWRKLSFSNLVPE